MITNTLQKIIYLKQHFPELVAQSQLVVFSLTKRTDPVERHSKPDQYHELYRFAELGKMNASLLHDIANPLMTVSIGLEGLRNGHDRQELIEYMQQGVETMETFLLSARTQLRRNPNYEFFVANEEIVKALKIFEQKLQCCSIKIELILDADAELYGEKIKFAQIMINLISNAIDAVEDKSKTGTIFIQTQQLPDKLFELTVQDSGPGIPQELSDKIFKPFFTTKEIHRGSGLGLAIVKEAVAEFNGEISLRQNKRSGACFVIKFPLAK